MVFLAYVNQWLNLLYLTWRASGDPRSVAALTVRAA
jgi:hypothetical protein